MKKINKIAVFLTIICISIIFTACAYQEKVSLKELNPALYEHPSGYSILLPSEWQINNSDSGGAYVVSKNNDIVINIYPEIGGMDYHSQDDQQQIISNMLGEFLTEVELVKQMNFGLNGNGCRLLLCGTDNNNQKWQTEAIYYAPFNGIHYYLFLSTPDKAYDSYSGLFTQISESLKVGLTEDQAYAMFILDEDEFTKKMAEGLHLQSDTSVNSFINNSENTQENT